MRTFLAIEISEKLREQLVEIQKALKPKISPVKWVEPENLHLSVEFLGDVEEAKIAEIAEVLEKIAVEVTPFELIPTQIVLIPSPRRPRVVAIGLRGDLEKFAELQDTIHNKLSALGFRFKPGKPPHLTLGRIKKPLHSGQTNRFARFLEEMKLPEFEPLNCASITLFKSQLTRTGPIYTVVKRVNFK